MKSLLSVVCLMSTSAAFADSKLGIESRVLEALVANSKDIVLVDDGGEAASRQLPQLIADQLGYGYLSVTQGDLILGSTSVSCDLKEARIGATQYQCRVTFANGDFKKINPEPGRHRIDVSRLEGPDLESATSVAVPVLVPVTPNAKAVILDSRLLVSYAG